MPDLIKKFFDTFEIEPYKTPSREYDSDGEICSYYIEYPEITDHILLELICIWNLYCTHTLIPTDYQKVKEYVLEQFANIDTYKFIVDTPIVKHQVRKLFKEE